MIKKYFLLAFLPFVIQAQTEQEEFRSASNTLYWKNRKPNAAYWQQDVNYSIKAKLIDAENIVDGDETLTYYNNSPNELPFVFFHLYSNAQTKGSYMSDLYKNNGVKLKYGKYRDAGLGTNVESITINGQTLKTEVDNTVMKVWLQSPLKAGESITFNIKFKTYFDNDMLLRNRMKLFGAFGYKHYNLVHWYPRISVYDAKQGWDTDQHMDHEFYGDFGSFHIELTLPNQYICDGTGVLQNEKEVLPTDLRQKLDIVNFAKKPFNSAPSEIIKPDGTFKTWVFNAINVHDAAYTFDPTYRIGEAMAGNVRCIALAQEQHAGAWQNAAAYVAKVIENNSKNIGQYAYPKMISADAEDGMEYPMITLNGGSDPGYRGLFIHEISHNWFFGMVGSNETYRAFLDEGFTQFYTCDGWENIEGKYNKYPKIKSAYVRNHTDSVYYRETNAYLRYFNDILRGDETTLNTHSDNFNGALQHGGGYGMVYMKTTVMLYNLRYVLGDDMFKAAMQNYFNQWKFCHPYPEDFRNSIIQFTNNDLNWFFDEWLETAKTIDYAVKKVKKIKGTDNQYAITFKRNGRMQMPLDFTVETSTHENLNFYIPNTWYEKKTSATILPRWIGWDKVKPTYTATVTIPSGSIKNVIIDTAHIMPDVNAFNNAKPRNYSFGFDSKIANPPNRNKYQLYARPALWYNGYDGVKAGVHFNGNYMNYKNVFDLTIWLNTQMGQAYLDKSTSVNSHDPFSVLFNYRTATDKFMKKSGFYTTLKALDGLASVLVGFDKKSNSEKTRFYVQLKGMERYNNYSLNYLIYKNEWSSVGLLNSSASFGIDHNYKYRRGLGFLNLNVRAPFLGDFNFSAATLTSVNKTYFGKLGLHTRMFVQYGVGSNIPVESMLFVAGANPEDLMDSKYTRSMGIFQPFNFGASTGNFAAGGGLNLRGYMGYLLPQIDANGNYRYNYKGTSGASVTAEVDFSRYFGFISKATKQTLAFGTYLFGDAGVINTNYNAEPFALSDIMVDAGVGTTLTIQKWGKLQTLKPLTIRADFPFFINRLPYAETNYFQFRWMIGVSRAF
ncbi:MAG TPA: M1 family metallopeptidase [Bacteroidia bacterium]|nr:M1 family metallopeptidase [Bacteroidia bacterium]